jgi:hypothetical protein
MGWYLPPPTSLLAWDHLRSKQRADTPLAHTEVTRDLRHVHHITHDHNYTVFGMIVDSSLKATRKRSTYLSSRA